MKDDFAVLKDLNVQIGVAETAGDRVWLERVIALQLSFRRASGVLVDRDAYLAAVAKTDERATDVESISLHGDRAFVSCVVTVHTSENEEEWPKFHNLRLFTRGTDGWKVMGWANAQIHSAQERTRESAPSTPGRT